MHAVTSGKTCLKREANSAIVVDAFSLIEGPAVHWRSFLNCTKMAGPLSKGSMFPLEGAWNSV